MSGTAKTINVRRNGTVTRPGIETPATSSLVKHERETLTVKIPGHSYWQGIGMKRGYAAAEYEVYKVLAAVDTEDGGKSFRVEFLTSFPVKTP